MVKILSKFRFLSPIVLIAALLFSVHHFIVDFELTTSTSTLVAPPFPYIRHKNGQKYKGTIIKADDPKCTYPSVIHALHNPPSQAPASLRKYIYWHREKRNCLMSSACHTKPKVLVYHCPKGNICSGLGDRMRGIRLSFVLAIIFKRVFLIDWPSQESDLYPLETAMLPNFLDWRLTPNISVSGPQAEIIEILGKTPQTALSFDKLMVPVDVSKDLLKMSNASQLFVKTTKEQFWIKALMRNPNIVKEIEGLTKLHIVSIERWLMTSLFRPSPNVAVIAHSVGFSKAERYVSIHARIGDDFGEMGNDHMKFFKHFKEAGAIKLLNCIGSMHPLGKKRIFLASDSMLFKDAFKNISEQRGIEVRSSKTMAIHLDKKTNFHSSNDESIRCRAFLNIFADMLNVADSYVLLSTGRGIEGSQFSDTAFYLGNGIVRRAVDLRGRIDCSPISV